MNFQIKVYCWRGFNPYSANVEKRVSS